MRRAVSFEGILELIALPAGLLIIVGVYTRQVSLVLAVLYFILFFLGPAPAWPVYASQRWRSDSAERVLLSLSVGRRRRRVECGPSARRGLDRQEVGADCAWACCRIAAACLFLMHGLEKIFGVGGGRIDRDIMTIRGFAGWLEIVGGPLFAVGLFTRPVAFILSGEMAVAYFRSWAPRGFWRSFDQAGMEASILFCFLFLFFWAAGPGAWSLDGWRGRKKGGDSEPSLDRVTFSRAPRSLARQRWCRATARGR